ncbi:MAG: hypothetical protein IH918_04355 [Acidobacteria bacterium]|nr:hypothetical protein [Acidobacteriota bacterium]
MTISRDDIEAKALELVDAVDDTRRLAQDKAILIAVAIGIVVVAAFGVGRRRGRRNKTVVEVYRV